MNNIPIIELAHLLTGALDENFNIKNQSAVIKVVSCLEAFNITHESYREVQNTRLIKDLQALRQNKANDQALAKRIKNLLRKWKERLASSVSANASHPNSPQNFSQGNSSDATIFMTQHSQSPPNSLLSTSQFSSSAHQQHQQQRLINGPTTFKNLIPKGPPSSVTSPAMSMSQLAPQQQQQFHYNNNNSNNSHIHQNGGFIESSSSSTATNLLLGKRKFDGNGNGTNDIDENSNHNRRKMMKMMKSGGAVGGGGSATAFGQISSSPNIPPPHIIQQQQQNNVNNVKPVPVLQLQQKQPTPPLMPTAAHNNINTTITTTQDPPKRRGRRKGAKGIDSTLNGTSIPTDFTTEIQQKIALSAGKRNKTTFELQKMLIESNQQQQNTSISTPLIVNGGDSVDSSTLDRVSLTSSLNASNHQQQPPSLKNLDNNSITTNKKNIKNEQQEYIEDEKKLLSNQLASSALRRSLTIEDEIARLESLLPPIDYEAAARDIFGDIATFNEDGDVVECTCSFREVITYEDEIDGGEKVINEVKINGDNAKHSSSDEIMSDDDDDDDDETDDFCAVEDIVEKSPPTSPIRSSAVKSIFDPEYDANENLIEEMVRSRKLMRDTPKVIEVKIEKDAVKSSRIETMMNNIVPDISTSQMPQQNSERVPIINYVCDEDPMCPARAHFQREPVTHIDINRLHSTNIVGVNGFFNGIPEEADKHDYSKDIGGGIDYAKHRLWKRVVPRYNFLTLDNVPKAFDDDSPFSIPPLPLPEQLCNDDDKDNDGVKIKKELVEDKDKITILNDHCELEFREWHQTMNVRSYKDEILTILPYVVID